jgi:hypothetical protein
MMTPDQIDRIVVGDVLQTPSGDYRVVRHIGTGPLRGDYPNQPYYFGFAIRRCSWTHRADTIKLRSEIANWTRVGVRIKLDSKLDELLRDDLDDSRNNPQLTCCDVRSMP